MNQALKYFLFCWALGFSSVGLADLTDDVKVIFTSSSPRYDSMQRHIVVSGHLHNASSASVLAPISLVIDSDTSEGHSIELQTPDGSLPDGKSFKVIFPQGELLPDGDADFEFYLAFTNPLSLDVVNALEKLAQKAFKFSVPANAQFNFAYHLLRIPAGNHQPVADAGVDRVGSVATTVVLDGSFSSDADGDSLAYVWQLDIQPKGSQVVLEDADSATPKLLADIPGLYQVSLTVTDGYMSSQVDKVTITINAVPGVNQPPKITSQPPESALATREMTVQIKAGDPDGDPLHYSLIQAPSGMSINASGVLQWLVADLPHQMIPVTLQVDDGRGGTAVQSFNIHIMPCVCP
jgi:hypothetical protein